MLCVVQFVNGQGEKKQHQDVYLKMYFAFLPFHFSKSVSQFVSLMSFRMPLLILDIQHLAGSQISFQSLRVTWV